ncbi:DNA mismatch repair endonuclease MutL [Shewanella submarina]|uniref:DNA mismatch repair protein MutL n=1 Tax=Shewanella submarina TaxID=2016376 RepID=A0ABV7GA87_9GAMM|nr:DNA mismatch repair endonuclease MutL [Shewanella submarina]MCL1039259.1 DNA mismatch repair endonuclease MutL [Shewanella submarina]
MAIKILPPQLANQIAAGEVVERPASVVKELVENSIDAGARRIDIDIEKGGAKLIRIRDNGGGIAKDELALALSRHATSKVETLDDLEAILSFGFRGEALASISSVSRLTMTSRTAEQSEAWAAYAEGSEMAVKVIPAAHPEGTTIEVVDLFFNTPARRRFLKSDKTEFGHIDEWLKRIALVRSDVHFTLSHNGKTVRNYRPATNEAQYLQRLGQVSGRPFADNALRVDCQHDDMSLSGYLQSPALVQPADVHYFYVNGRLVRDRLVNHAVRQAFAQMSELDQPGYVLMLELDPHQVDVNVHPAKHEVRFHQSRYVHDFILQALQSALSQAHTLPVNTQSQIEQPQADYSAQPWQGMSSPAGVVSQGNDRAVDGMTGQRSYSGNYPSSSSGSGRNGDWSGSAGRAADRYVNPQLDKAAVEAYGQLMQTPEQSRAEQVRDAADMPPVLAGKFWVVAKDSQLVLVDIAAAAAVCRKSGIRDKLETGLVGQPLLMPVSVAADEQWADTIEMRETLLRRLGIELVIKYGQLIIKKVPPYLRDSQLASNIPDLLQWLAAEEPANEALAAWLTAQTKGGFDAAASVWQQLKQYPETQQQILAQGRSLPWESWLEEQLSEHTTTA